MAQQLSRRDFLKLLPLIPALKLRIPQLVGLPENSPQTGNLPNILILVFDTLSAHDVSLCGYPRETMPNLARFAERATLYHNHHSAGSFTTSGTASLLTGTYPWTHRAVQFDDTVVRPYERQTIFSLLSKNYYRVAYTHNPLADTLLNQFSQSLETHVPLQELFLYKDYWASEVLSKDYDTAIIGRRLILRREDGLAGSLFLSKLDQAWANNLSQEVENVYGDLFPRGIPSINDTNYFLLEDAIDWIKTQVSRMPQPFLAYFHLLPPHDPYNTRTEFVDIFDDNWSPPPKPEHIFSKGNSRGELLDNRRRYDEYIAYVDAEFGRLVDGLRGGGTLENTWLIVTSDHGEMFERGILGHTWLTLHQPLLQVPLLISQPGQKTRVDVYSRTSSVDVLPTLLHLTGQEIPNGCEGEILPPFREDTERGQDSKYALDAKRQSGRKPISQGTAAIFQGDYKLTYYFGYPAYEPFTELYDLKNDPEELEDLAQTKKTLESDLLNALESKLKTADEPFRD